MSENRNPNKKRRANPSEERGKRRCMPQGRAAASTVSVTATSANASHGSTNRVGSNSNKRAREELSTVPSSIIKRARANPAPAPATLPLPLPFTLTPPLPRVTKSNKLSAEEVPIYGHRSTEQQLQAAAAALIALAQNAQNINKSSSIDEAVVLPGGKRIRIEVPVISSSNNNGIGRPRPSRRRNNVAGPIPIWNLRTAPAPTTASAPAPTEATAATSTTTTAATATAAEPPSIPINTDHADDKEVDVSLAPAKPKKRERSNDSSNEFLPTKKIRVPSISILLSNTRKQNKSLRVHFSTTCNAQPFDKESTPENVSNDFREHVIIMKTILRGVVEEEQAPEEEAGNEPTMDANESESMPVASSPGQQSDSSTSALDDSLDDDDLPDLEGFTEAREKSKVKVVRYDIDDLPPAFENEEDYPPGWLVYRPGHGVITRERLLELERDEATEEVHFNVADNAVDEDGDEDDVASTTEEEDAEPSNTEDNGEDGEEEDEESSTVNSQPRFEFDPAAMDAPEMDVDNDGQESVDFDVASNASESNNTEAIEEEEEEEEEDAMDEEEEVEVVQPAPRRRSRMLAEIESTLDGWYWRQATTRRSVDRN